MNIRYPIYEGVYRILTIDFTGSRNPLTWKQFVTGADMPYFTMMNYLIMNRSLFKDNG